jgi:hypothetical protein
MSRMQELVDRLLLKASKGTIEKADELWRRCPQSIQRQIDGYKLPAYCLDLAFYLNKDTFDTDSAAKFLTISVADYTAERRTVAASLNIPIKGPSFESLATKLGSNQVAPMCHYIMNEFLKVRRGQLADSQDLVIGVFLAVAKAVHVSTSDSSSKCLLKFETK